MFNKYTIIICLAVLFLILLIISKRKKKDIIALLSIFTICSVFVLSSNYIFNNVLAKHQKERINVLIKKDIDPHGSGYNLIQSKIAIGSGGTLGKGFLNGTQTRFDFVPEQSTDFIFCTIGEEWGFLGSIVFILLFTSLLLRILFLAERQRSNFSRIYGYSVATILFALFIKYRNDNWTCSCNRYSSPFYKLWRVILTGIYNFIIYFSKSRLL